MPKINIQNQNKAVIKVQNVGDEDYINCVAVPNGAGWTSHSLAPVRGL